MAKTQRELLFQALLDKGFPREYCETLVTKYLNTDFTATRMLGYLYRYSEPSIEQVTDEMLAILADREEIRQKHEMEFAQAKINEIYQNGLGVEEDEDA